MKRNRKTGLLLAGVGLVLLIPTGVDDVVVNVPLGVLIGKIVGVSPIYTIPLTYFLGIPFLVLAFLFLTKRQWNKMLKDNVGNRFDL